MYTPSANFNTLVAKIETLVAAIDYRGICDALTAHAKAQGYSGRAFNNGFNTNNVKRWCKAESSDGRLQYILAGLGKDSDRGRYDVLMQWDYLCCNNVATQTELRSLKNNKALQDGIARYYPKRDSVWGTVEAREAGNIVATTAMPDKTRKQLAEKVTLVDNAKRNNDRSVYDTCMGSIANAILACNKPVKVKKTPASEKPASKPATAKPATAKGKAPKAA
jgi:hypothetical protein